MERMKMFVAHRMMWAMARRKKEVVVDLSSFGISEEDMERRLFFELDREFKEEAMLFLLPKNKIRIVFNLK